MKKRSDRQRISGYIWHHLWKSSSVRLLLIVIALLIPMNVLMQVLAFQLQTEASNQIISGTKRSLSIAINQIDDTLVRASNSMKTLSVENADYRRLQSGKSDSREDYYQNVNATVNLRLELKSRLEDFSLLTGVFCYFPEKEFVQYATTEYRIIPVQETVKEIILAEDASAFLNGRILVLQGTPILLSIQPIRDNWTGAWIDLNRLSEKLSLQMETPISFEDSEGRLWGAYTGEMETTALKQNMMNQWDQQYNLISVASQNGTFKIAQFIPTEGILASLPRVITLLRILTYLSLLILPLIIFLFQRWMLKPIATLLDAMEVIESGNINYRLNGPKRGAEFDYIYHRFNEMMDELSSLKIQVYEHQLNAQKTKLAFLSQQIKPHFILNTLNILYCYEAEDFPLIQRMLMLLSKYFRYIVSADRDYITLGKEIEHISTYFEIQEARFPERFHAEIQHDENLSDCLVPPLLLQSFAENSIKYALTPGDRVLISITTRQVEEDKLVVSISDSGTGFKKEILDKIHDYQNTHHHHPEIGVGIQNSIDRIELIYGPKGKVQIENRQPHGVCIEMELPIMKGEDEF